MSRTIWLTESWLQAQLTEAGRWAYIDLVEDRTGRGRSWDADDILGVITAAQFPLVSAAIREAEARGREQAAEAVSEYRDEIPSKLHAEGSLTSRTMAAVAQEWLSQACLVARGVRVESPAEETQP